MKRKSIKLVTTTLLLSTLLSFSSLAAWEQSEQGWKYKDDNTQQYVTDRWIESATEKGLWYYIDANGVMVTNAWIDDVYYVNEAGEWRESTGGGSSNQSHNQNINQGDPFAPGNVDPSMVNGGTDKPLENGGTGSSEADWNFLHNR